MNRILMRALVGAVTLVPLSLSAVTLYASTGGATKMASGDHHMVVTLGDLEISSGFAKATLPGAPVGGGFLTIKNNGKTDDTLISAHSSVAGEVQLHNMSVVNDVMKMYEMEGGIPIPAGETVSLAPGGLHIMFMQLKEQLVEGQMVKVSLTFEHAGTTEVMLEVKTVTGKKGMGSMKHSLLNGSHQLTGPMAAAQGDPNLMKEDNLG